MAIAHRKTPAQVILRGGAQGVIVIPRSETPHRIAENIDIFDFELRRFQMQQISHLDAGLRTAGDPATFDFSQA